MRVIALFSVIRGTPCVAILAAMACLTAEPIVSQTLETAPNLHYIVSGRFAIPQAAGNDTFKLAGQTFSITVVANTATTPHQHGKAWADYTDLKLRGTVHTGLDPSAVPVVSQYTFLALAVGNPSFQLFQVHAPVLVIRQKVTVSANIQMPTGTLVKGWRVYPFSAPIALDPANAAVTYTNGSDSTTLQIANGTLNATYASPATTLP